MKRTLYYLSLSLLIALSACNSIKKSKSPTENVMENRVITGNRWKLIELSGKPVSDTINGKEPFLLLHKEDNRYSASGGCNGLGGTYTLSGNNKLKFSQGMSTMMACEDMTIESGFNEIIMIVDNYTINGNILSLNKAKMAPLARFQWVAAGKE